MRNDHLHPLFADLLNKWSGPLPAEPKLLTQLCPYCYGSGQSQVETTGTQYSSCAWCAGRGTITVEEIEIKP